MFGYNRVLLRHCGTVSCDITFLYCVTCLSLLLDYRCFLVNSLASLLNTQNYGTYSRKRKKMTRDVGDSLVRFCNPINQSPYDESLYFSAKILTHFSLTPDAQIVNNPETPLALLMHNSITYNGCLVIFTSCRLYIYMLFM